MSDYRPEDYVGLIYHCIQELYAAGKVPADFGESVYFGYMGLRRAIELYDPARGLHFNTYAGWKIRNYILDGLRIERGDRRVRKRAVLRAGPLSESLVDGAPAIGEALANSDHVAASVSRLFALARLRFRRNPITLSAFMDHYQKGLTQVEIARGLGGSPEVINARLREVRKFLKAVA